LFLKQLRTQNDTFLENLFSILHFESERNIAKLRKAVDKVPDWKSEMSNVKMPKFKSLTIAMSK
jgi:hypothetical protein